MPGPYDIYSGEDSYSSRLPLGIGSDSLTSMWPDVLAIGGGSLLQRWGMRQGMGRDFFSGDGMLKFGWTNQEKVMRRSLRRRNYAATAKNPQRSTARYFRRRAVDGVSRTSRTVYDTLSAGQNPGVMVGRSNVTAGRNPGVMVGRGPMPKGRTQHSLMSGGKRLTPDQARPHMQKLHSRSMRGAFKFQWGTMLKGLGVGLAAAQTGAMIADFGKMATDAAMDWRPRKDSFNGTPGFGDSFYDPRGAYTQRQRAIMAIHDSQLTTRAAIGGEAAFMHR